MLPLVAVLLSIVAALVVFSGLLLGGVWVVRRLGLSQDPPEAVRYSPPPPPLVEVIDPGTARATAILQERRRQVYASARALRAGGAPAESVVAADALIDGVRLDAADLQRVELALAALPAHASP